jgi:tRNA nucleotidyltransferase/poly(A) polymerase
MNIEDFPNRNFQWLNNPVIWQVLNKLNHHWYLVGGCVRDSLVGIETKDIDVVTTLLPDEVVECVKDFHPVLVGKKFGTVGVFIQDWKIEITTTRLDITTYGRHADVQFTNSFEEDSHRRDFTINALLYNGKELLDYHHGLEDLKFGRVRFIGDAKQRIEEDYLRIFRYIRFAVKYSDYINYNTIIRKSLVGLKNISNERIIMEITSMCKNPNIKQAIFLINHFGISRYLWQTNLPIDADLESLSLTIKLARIFRNISIPVTREVLQYIKVFHLNDLTPVAHMAKIWLRYPSCATNLIHEFIKLYLLTHPNDPIAKIFTFDFNAHKPPHYITQFVGPMRGNAELLFRNTVLQHHIEPPFSKFSHT